MNPSEPGGEVQRWTLYVCDCNFNDGPGPRCGECGEEVERIEVAPLSELQQERQRLGEALTAEFEKRGAHHANVARKLELEGRGEFNGGDLGAERAYFEAAEFILAALDQSDSAPECERCGGSGEDETLHGRCERCGGTGR